ncbi:tetratricopeptide repeat protein [Kitasatospora sp. NPDC052896]|uniref:tetratricopeptide repeat protein n=1 Tax=Kitasatospora sp. NPDC052896 TaxID=3364061 RepID=UPI0037CC5E0D
MKRTRLWTGLAAAAVAASSVIGWVQLSKADPSTRKVVSSRPPTSADRAQADALLQAAVQQGQIHDLAGAARTLKRVLELDAGNKRAWYNLGVIAQRDNRTADARAAYDSALKSDPNYEPALYNKAILIEPSDTDQAVAIFRRIVAADPKAATAYLNLGQALAKQGRDDEAQGAFGHAVEVDSSLQQLVPDKFRNATSAAPSPTTESHSGR